MNEPALRHAARQAHNGSYAITAAHDIPNRLNWLLWLPTVTNPIKTFVACVAFKFIIFAHRKYQAIIFKKHGDPRSKLPLSAFTYVNYESKDTK